MNPLCTPESWPYIYCVYCNKMLWSVYSVHGGSMHRLYLEMKVAMELCFLQIQKGSSLQWGEWQSWGNEAMTATYAFTMCYFKGYFLPAVLPKAKVLKLSTPASSPDTSTPLAIKQEKKATYSMCPPTTLNIIYMVPSTYSNNIPSVLEMKWHRY